jgi:hypothetical protein
MGSPAVQAIQVLRILRRHIRHRPKPVQMPKKAVQDAVAILRHCRLADLHGKRP